MSRPCVVCGRGTYPASPRPDAEQRAVLHAEGKRRAGGRGACVNCYQVLRLAGRLEELPLIYDTAKGADDPEAKDCARCGVKHRAPADICQDCRLVLSDLGELERWAS